MCYHIGGFGYNNKDNHTIMLNIKNQYKLLGKTLYSKFLPQSGEWSVVSILKDEFSYDIKIQNTQTRDVDRIYLDRRPHYDPADFEPHYRLWGMNKYKSEEKSKLIKKIIIKDIDRLLIYMLMVLKEMKYTL